MARDTDESSVGSWIYPVDGGPAIRIQRPETSGSRPTSKRYSYRPRPRDLRKPIFVEHTKSSTTEKLGRGRSDGRQKSARKSSRRESNRQERPKTGKDAPDGEYMLNEFYGGHSMPPQCGADDFQSVAEEEQIQQPSRRRTSHRPTVYGIEASVYSGADDQSDRMQGTFLSKRPDVRMSDYDNRNWDRAGKPYEEERGLVKALPTLLLIRHGHLLRTKPFLYLTDEWHNKKDRWDDGRLAATLKFEYGSLKLGEIGPMQRLFAYKTIAYIYVVQSRYRLNDDMESKHLGRWQVVDRVPITTRSDEMGRDAFMHKLRHPRRYADETYWTGTINNLLQPGVVIDLEIVETFDSIKLYLGLLLAVILSLGVSLGYGFAMGNDFGTGFSIGSWVLTAFGFFAAVIAAGEYFGMDKKIPLSARPPIKLPVKVDDG